MYFKALQKGLDAMLNRIVLSDFVSSIWYGMVDTIPGIILTIIIYYCTSSTSTFSVLIISGGHV